MTDDQLPEPVAHYFVSCVETDGRRRKSLLAGPYATHEAALAQVRKVARMTEDVDPRAAWFAFGTASAETPFATVFGVVS
jgi:hypothetical protein